MIQVKRTFCAKQVRKGVRNVVQAKQHLLNVLWKDNCNSWSSSPVPGSLPQVFTAVVGFADDDGTNCRFYRRLLLKWNLRQRACNRLQMIETDMYVLPSFIGSLTSQFLYVDGRSNYWNHRYYVCDSYHGQANICIQALLAKIYTVVGKPGETPPFAFPLEMNPIDDFHVLRFTRAAWNRDGTITIVRNDKWKGTYQKREGAVTNPPHYTCDTSGRLHPTDLLARDTMPRMLYVKRDGIVTQYEMPGQWEPGAKTS
jgi:hypothetical protein